MRRVIRRTRTSSSSTRRRFGGDYNRNRRDDYDNDRDDNRSTQTSEPRDRDKLTSGSVKKKSPWGIIIIVIIIGVVIWAVFRGSSETTNETKQAEPESVVKAVMAALGQNRVSTAKNYVATGDSVTSNQVTTLFNNYSGYFTYDDDYINFSNMTYNLTSQSDTEAQVTVAGRADIVEVTYEIYEDEWGDEVEDEVEAVVDEFTFTGIKFSLKKTGEKWFLSEVPATIF